MYWLTLLKNPEIAQTFHMGGSESLNNAVRNLPHLSPPFWFALFYVGVNLRQMRTCDCNRAYNSSRLPSVSEGHLLPPWTNHCVFAGWDQRLWEVSLSEVHDSSASCGRGNRVLDWRKREFWASDNRYKIPRGSQVPKGKYWLWMRRVEIEF